MGHSLGKIDYDFVVSDKSPAIFQQCNDCDIYKENGINYALVIASGDNSITKLNLDNNTTVFKNQPPYSFLNTVAIDVSSDLFFVSCVWNDQSILVFRLSTFTNSSVPIFILNNSTTGQYYQMALDIKNKKIYVAKHTGSTIDVIDYLLNGTLTNSSQITGLNSPIGCVYVPELKELWIIENLSYTIKVYDFNLLSLKQSITITDNNKLSGVSLYFGSYLVQNGTIVISDNKGGNSNNNILYFINVITRKVQQRMVVNEVVPFGTTRMIYNIDKNEYWSGYGGSEFRKLRKLKKHV